MGRLSAAHLGIRRVDRPADVLDEDLPGFPAGHDQTALRELRDYLQASRQHLDLIARALENIQGPRTLETATITFPASGYVERSYRIPFAAIAALNLGNSQVTICNAGAQSPVPGPGQGQQIVPANRFLGFNMAGQTVTFYGAAGQQVSYSVFVDRIQPCSGLGTSTFTLFGQRGGGVLQADATAYTLGVQVSVSQAAPLDAVWWYSAPGAVALPQTIALFNATTQALIHSEAATWSGAAGSGWVRAPFTSPPALAPGTQYEVCVNQNTAVNWYSATVAYWTTGPGSAGLTSGPLSAPNNAGALNGQDSFHAAAALTYPATSSGGANYYIDPEIT